MFQTNQKADSVMTSTNFLAQIYKRWYHQHLNSIGTMLRKTG